MDNVGENYVFRIQTPLPPSLFWGVQWSTGSIQTLLPSLLCWGVRWSTASNTERMTWITKRLGYYMSPLSYISFIELILADVGLISYT